MRMREWIVVGWMLSVLMGLVVACGGDTAVDATSSTQTDAAVTAVDLVPYVSSESGLSLQIPAGWVTNDAYGGLTVASDREVIEGDSLANIGDEGFVLLLPIEREVLNYQTGQTLEEGDTGQAVVLYRSLLEREGASYEVIEPPYKLETGPNATYIVVRSTGDGVNLLTLMGAAMDAEQVVLISASAQEDAFPELRPTFERMLKTLEIAGLP